MPRPPGKKGNGGSGGSLGGPRPPSRCPAVLPAGTDRFLSVVGAGEWLGASHPPVSRRRLSAGSIRLRGSFPANRSGCPLRYDRPPLQHRPMLPGAGSGPEGSRAHGDHRRRRLSNGRGRADRRAGSRDAEVGSAGAGPLTTPLRNLHRVPEAVTDEEAVFIEINHNSECTSPTGEAVLSGAILNQESDKRWISRCTPPPGVATAVWQSDSSTRGASTTKRSIWMTIRKRSRSS